MGESRKAHEGHGECLLHSWMFLWHLYNAGDIVGTRYMFVD